MIGRLSSTFGKNLFPANDKLRLAIVLHGIGDSLVSKEIRVISVERDHNELKEKEAGVLAAVQTLTQLLTRAYYLLVRLEQDPTFEEMKRLFLELNNIFYAGHMIRDYDMLLYLNARNHKKRHTLSLDEDIVEAAREVTDNLSETVRALLQRFISEEEGEKIRRSLAEYENASEERRKGLGIFSDSIRRFL